MSRRGDILEFTHNTPRKRSEIAEHLGITEFQVRASINQMIHIGRDIKVSGTRFDRSYEFRGDIKVSSPELVKIVLFSDDEPEWWHLHEIMECTKLTSRQVNAGIDGLKKRGYKIESKRNGGGRTPSEYRVIK